MSDPMTVPNWVCTLVGKLVLDNEALRQELAKEQDFTDSPAVLLDDNPAPD